MDFESNMPSPSLNNLPSCLVEMIFSYLPFKELMQAQVVSQYICAIAGKYMKKNVDKLRQDICNVINKVSEELNITYATSDSRYSVRIYCVLKTMLESLDMAIVLNRHLIDSEKCSSIITNILDRYFKILKDLQCSYLTLDKLNTIQLNLQNSIVYLMWSLEKSCEMLRNHIPLGVRVIDLLDLVEDVSYKIFATYNIKSYSCTINLNYHLENPKILTYIPIIPYVKDCQKRTLTVEEQEAIMKYLIMLVNVHNKLEGKTVQYKRELEISRRECMINKELILSQPPLYKQISPTKARSFNERHILDVSEGKILEVYDKYDRVNVDHGMTCTVNLTCQIDEAPLCIKESFKKLRHDIEMEEPSVNDIPTNIFEEISSKEKIYSFDFKLRVRLPSKTPEIFEINFFDGSSNEPDLKES